MEYISWFISPITVGLMNGGYIYSIHGDYKPTFTSLGGHHLVAAEAGLGSPETQDPTLARAEAWKMSKSEGSPF